MHCVQTLIGSFAVVFVLSRDRQFMIPPPFFSICLWNQKGSDGKGAALSTTSADAVLWELNQDMEHASVLLLLLLFDFFALMTLSFNQILVSCTETQWCLTGTGQEVLMFSVLSCVPMMMSSVTEEGDFRCLSHTPNPAAASLPRPFLGLSLLPAPPPPSLLSPSPCPSLPPPTLLIYLRVSLFNRGSLHLQISGKKQPHLQTFIHQELQELSTRKKKKLLCCDRTHILKGSPKLVKFLLECLGFEASLLV